MVQYNSLKSSEGVIGGEHMCAKQTILNCALRKLPLWWPIYQGGIGQGIRGTVSQQSYSQQQPECSSSLAAADFYLLDQQTAHLVAPANFLQAAHPSPQSSCIHRNAAPFGCAQTDALPAIVTFGTLLRHITRTHMPHPLLEV